MAKPAMAAQHTSKAMIDHIRNNTALAVVNSPNETTVAKNSSGRQQSQKDEATLTFLEKRHPKNVLPGEKGSLLDIYA